MFLLRLSRLPAPHCGGGKTVWTRPVMQCHCNGTKNTSFFLAPHLRRSATRGTPPLPPKTSGRRRPSIHHHWTTQTGACTGALLQNRDDFSSIASRGELRLRLLATALLVRASTSWSWPALLNSKDRPNQTFKQDSPTSAFIYPLSFGGAPFNYSVRHHGRVRGSKLHRWL